MLMPLNSLGIQPTNVLHLGAHTGEEAEQYIQANCKTVVWFECCPNVMPILRHHVEPLGQYVIEAAVTNKDNVDLVFNINTNTACSSVLPLGKHLHYHPHMQVARQIMVKGYTVDTLLEQHGFKHEIFDFANLDLQGYELQALQGMHKCLQYIKWLYMEVNEAELYKGCCLLPEMDAFLKGYGFTRTKTAPTGYEWSDAFYVKN